MGGAEGNGKHSGAAIHQPFLGTSAVKLYVAQIRDDI
jgi:hypothetical protein